MPTGVWPWFNRTRTGVEPLVSASILARCATLNFEPVLATEGSELILVMAGLGMSLRDTADGLRFCGCTEPIVSNLGAVFSSPGPGSSETPIIVGGPLG